MGKRKARVKTSPSPHVKGLLCWYPGGRPQRGVGDLYINTDIRRTKGEKGGRRDEGERGRNANEGRRKEVNGRGTDKEEDKPTARRSNGEDVHPAMSQDTEESKDPPPPGRQAEESHHGPRGTWLAQVHAYLPNTGSLMWTWVGGRRDKGRKGEGWGETVEE
ncbi:hypothetical protein NDU88_003114 [Pleurodeles waltl]|uniref:Uncharacterized protein n=1 Tax=Pleurodeles waltl TaxID=8319 RepID=A0AAV7W182_PLEWA|nr:hypothetical protein NDU88_003114 [Pleurodeles waltl]